jgi:hypothetical protein
MNAGRTLVALLAIAIALAVAGCRLLRPDYTIHVSNASSLRLTILVNGQPVGDLRPDSRAHYRPDRLPPRPWTVDARMGPNGRVVASITVADGDIQDDRALDGTGRYRSVGSRVTLTCGQVWLWVGEQGSGGGLAEGIPGDCDP